MSIPQSINKKKSSLKTLLIILVFGVVILGIILFLGSRSGKPQTPATGLVSQSSGTEVSAGSLSDTNSTVRRSDEIVAILNSVSSIDLDDSIFRNPAFAKLRDINSLLPTDRNPGRTNPFLPIGQEIPSSTTVFQTEINTLESDIPTTTPGDTVTSGDAALQEFIGTQNTTSSL